MQEIVRGVVTTNVYEATQKVMELSALSGHPGEAQTVMNILFGVDTGDVPLSEKCIQDALLYTWDHWYKDNERYATDDTPMEKFLGKYRK